MSAAWGALRLLVVAAVLAVAASIYAGVARAALPDPTAATTTPVTTAVADTTTAVDTTAAQAVAPAATATSPVEPVVQTATTAVQPVESTAGSAASTATDAATATVGTAVEAATASPAVQSVTQTAGPIVEKSGGTATTTVDNAVAPIAALAADTTAAVTQDSLSPATGSLATQPPANPGSQTSAATPTGSRPDVASGAAAATPPPAAAPAGEASVQGVNPTARARAHAGRSPSGADSRQLSAPRFAWGVPPTAVTSGAVRAASSGDKPRGPLPGGLPPMNGVGAFASGGGGGIGVPFFGLIGFLLLLAIPTAVRWLRPAAALGLTPAYVAPGDRPG
jgi:hypothetical protein